MKSIKIGTAEAEPGKKGFGAVSVGKSPSGFDLQFPVYIVNGVQEGPKLLSTAGTHGDETESIMALATLAKKLDPKNMSGAFIGVPVLNVPAFESRRRGVPMWGPTTTDLNRVFYLERLHSSLGGVTSAMAAAYWNEVVSKVDYSIAHHGGPSNCFLQPRIIAEKEIPETLEIAKDIGGEWEIIQVGTGHVGTLHHACRIHNIVAITMEHGGGGGRHPNIMLKSVENITTGIMNIMRHLGIINKEPVQQRRKWTMIERDDPYPRQGGLSIPLRAAIDSLNNIKLLEKGTPLMKIIDVFGEEVETIKAPSDGIIIGLKTDPVTHPWDRILWFGKYLETLTR
jgi:predicted deacylase